MLNTFSFVLDFNQKLVCHEKLFLFGLTHATKDAITTGLVNFCSKHFVRLIVLKFSPLELEACNIPFL